MKMHAISLTVNGVETALFAQLKEAIESIYLVNIVNIKTQSFDLPH